jgi:hypothetical protein
MSTELQQQLARIRESTLQASSSLHQGRPSLFLTPKEASLVDISTIYDAAISGLSVLEQYDSRFSYYLENIFHPSNVSLQRELKTTLENKELDKDINSLLLLLSPFADDGW